MIYNFQIFCQLPATVSVLWVNVSGQWPYRAFVYLWFLQVKGSGGKAVVSVILIFFIVTKWTWQFSVSATISADTCIKPMNLLHFVFLAFLIFKKQKKKIKFCDFRNMLKLGGSKHWKEALKQMTGDTYIRTEPFKKYFQPLIDFLMNENKGDVGWAKAGINWERA